MPIIWIMLIPARWFSKKYAARKCNTFNLSMAFSFSSEVVQTRISPVPAGACAPILLKLTA